MTQSHSYIKEMNEQINNITPQHNLQIVEKMKLSLLLPQREDLSLLLPQREDLNLLLPQREDLNLLLPQQEGYTFANVPPVPW
jgi:hypothetical protein